MNHSYSQTLNRLVGYFESELKAVPEEVFRHKPGPAKWSKQEIVGHLCDSAANNHLRFVQIKLSAHPVSLEGYDQDRWVDLHGYQEQYNLTDIITLWVMLNRQIVHVLERLTAEDYGKTCILPGGAEATLDWLVNDYLEHMRHHFRQILGPESVERADAGT
ncbi:DinB family protein [Paenibacillus cellulositrophicus]|uniref:DinB family protein n=1 Tax=Paenibacillus cellulositrophicus TaxID=562959 RepID=UPI0012675956|nr:DinB family protein [Paenibacillus cellulositrophicus]